MIARAGSGWQTLMADLSIILFMVTAAALSQSKDGQAAAPSPSARSEPLAVYRSGAGAPPLGQWLAAQSPDPRQQLSIVAHYPAGGQQAALAEAAQLLGDAGAAGSSARLVVEPGEGGIVATLAYDLSYDLTVAQGLLGGAAKPETRP